MSPIQVTVDGNAPLFKALYLMIKENVGLMPVIQDSRVAGMIRLSDLFVRSPGGAGRLDCPGRSPMPPRQGHFRAGSIASGG